MRATRHWAMIVHNLLPPCQLPESEASRDVPPQQRTQTTGRASPQAVPSQLRFLSCHRRALDRREGQRLVSRQLNLLEHSPSRPGSHSETLLAGFFDQSPGARCEAQRKPSGRERQSVGQGRLSLVAPKPESAVTSVPMAGPEFGCVPRKFGCVPRKRGRMASSPPALGLDCSMAPRTRGKLKWPVRAAKEHSLRVSAHHCPSAAIRTKPHSIPSHNPVLFGDFATEARPLP